MDKNWLHDKLKNGLSFQFMRARILQDAAKRLIWLDVWIKPDSGNRPTLAMNALIK